MGAQPCKSAEAEGQSQEEQSRQEEDFALLHPSPNDACSKKMMGQYRKEDMLYSLILHT